jgi:hypothetical protein
MGNDPIERIAALKVGWPKPVDLSAAIKVIEEADRLPSPPPSKHDVTLFFAAVGMMAAVLVVVWIVGGIIDAIFDAVADLIEFATHICGRCRTWAANRSWFKKEPGPSFEVAAPASHRRARPFIRHSLRRVTLHGPHSVMPACACVACVQQEIATCPMEHLGAGSATSVAPSAERRSLCRFRCLRIRS